MQGSCCLNARIRYKCNALRRDTRLIKLVAYLTQSPSLNFTCKVYCIVYRMFCHTYNWSGLSSFGLMTKYINIVWILKPGSEYNFPFMDHPRIICVRTYQVSFIPYTPVEVQLAMRVLLLVGNAHSADPCHLNAGRCNIFTTFIKLYSRKMITAWHISCHKGMIRIMAGFNCL